MPFQPINFAAIPPIGNPGMRDLVPTLMQGFQAGAMPGQLRRQAQAELMANELAKLRLQQEPQEFAANMKSKDLANAFQTMLNQEQPQKFGYEVKANELATNPFAKFNYENTLVNLLKNASATPSPLVGAPAPVRPPMRTPDNFQITPEQANNLLNSGAAQNAPPGTTDNYWTQMLRKGLGFPAQTPAEKAQQQVDIYRAEHGPMQTPEQKAQQQVDIANKKQEAKTSMITPATATQNQQAILAIKNTLPMLDELKTMAPEQTYGRFLHPIDQTNYETKRTLILDKLMASLKVPKTSEPYLKLEKALSRSLTDTDETYAARLESIKKDLLQQGGIYSNAAKIIKNPFPLKKDIKNMSTEDLLKIYRGGS